MGWKELRNSNKAPLDPVRLEINRDPYKELVSPTVKPILQFIDYLRSISMKGHRFAFFISGASLKGNELSWIYGLYTSFILSFYHNFL